MSFQLYYTYILASRENGGSLYVGVTSDLKSRVSEHKDGIGSKHTTKYGIDRLLYYEEFYDVELAIAREKTLKRWKRKWKDELITNFNPAWRDLYDEV